MTDAEAETPEEDKAAAELQKREQKLYDNIVKRIQMGKTPDEVVDWLDSFYAWDPYTSIRTTCIKATRALYRQELTKAQEALEKAGTG